MDQSVWNIFFRGNSSCIPQQVRFKERATKTICLEVVKRFGALLYIIATVKSYMQQQLYVWLVNVYSEIKIMGFYGDNKESNHSLANHNMTGMTDQSHFL